MKSPQLSLTRRRFLFAAATGGVGAAAAIMKVQPRQSARKDRSEPEPASGYRLTDHVRSYYRTTRI